MNASTYIGKVEEFETTRYGMEGTMRREMILDNYAYAAATTDAERRRAYYVRSAFTAYDTGSIHRATFRKARRADFDAIR